MTTKDGRIFLVKGPVPRLGAQDAVREDTGAESLPDSTSPSELGQPEDDAHDKRGGNPRPALKE